MTAVTSRVPAVIDYLVATFAAAATLGAASPPVAVYDGPAPADGSPTLVLWVGVSSPEATPPEAATSQQAWKGQGRMSIDEDLAVFCCAMAWTGAEEGGFHTARLAAAGIVAAVEAIVHADASLGGNVAVPGNAQVTNTVWTQAATAQGPAVQVTFEITAKARIGG